MLRINERESYLPDLPGRELILISLDMDLGVGACTLMPITPVDWIFMEGVDIEYDCAGD